MQVAPLDQWIEQALRRTRPGANHRYVTLARLHRQNAMLCASLAVKLKLTPSSKIDKNVSRDGDRPLAVAGLGYPAQAAASDPVIRTMSAPSSTASALSKRSGNA